MQMSWRRVSDISSPAVHRADPPVSDPVRYAAFRLIEAGLEQNQPFEGPYVLLFNNRR